MVAPFIRTRNKRQMTFTDMQLRPCFPIRYNIKEREKKKKFPGAHYVAKIPLTLCNGESRALLAPGVLRRAIPRRPLAYAYNVTRSSRGGSRISPRFPCTALLRRANVMLMQFVINVVVIKRRG